MIIQTFPNSNLFHAAFFFWLFFFFLLSWKYHSSFILFSKQNKELICYRFRFTPYYPNSRTKGQRKCNVWTKKTCNKCGKCSKPRQPSVLCKEELRDCFVRFHILKVFIIFQVVYHSKAAIALNRYIMI